MKILTKEQWDLLNVVYAQQLQAGQRTVWLGYTKNMEIRAMFTEQPSPKLFHKITPAFRIAVAEYRAILSAYKLYHFSPYMKEK